VPLQANIGGYVALTDQRQRELEQASIRAYQQISAGFPEATIREEIASLDLEPDEFAWVWNTGKQRYFGYQHHLRDVNRGSAKSFIVGGALMLGIVAAIVSSMGWPTAGRQVGMANMAMIGGAGSLMYGLYCWLTASPSDTRVDLN
jgi:hypothetical protein